MSEPTVDVLNRLYRVLHAGRFYDDHDESSELLGELREARAAVAELIAFKEATEYMLAGRPGELRAINYHAAGLARVGGAK